MWLCTSIEDGENGSVTTYRRDPNLPLTLFYALTPFSSLNTVVITDITIKGRLLLVITLYHLHVANLSRPILQLS